MDRWIGKVAVVTGASSGIGAATVIDLVKSGMIVVGLARRVDRIEELQTQIPKNCNGKLYGKMCDISVEKEVKTVFKWIDDNLGGISVLINNAGMVVSMNTIDNDNSDALRQVVETNLLGSVWCTKEAFKSMKNHNIDGHIILMNSYLGHKIPYLAGSWPSLNVYPATKFGITAMTEVLRQEFQTFGTKIKITSISPGLVKTDIFSAELQAMLENTPHLFPADVSAAILYVLGTPPHVQIHELTLKPIGEPF